METKRCSACKLPKSIEEFPVHQIRNGVIARKHRCQPCHRAHYNAWNAEYLKNHPEVHERRKKKSRDWHHRNTDRILNTRMEYGYSWSLDKYNKQLKKQKGRCAICRGLNRNGRRLYVDHDHETGVIRGLLCHKCNAGLGAFRDSSALLEKALKYIQGR